MIRRHLMALRLGLMVVDGLIGTLVFAGVSLVRFGDGVWLTIWTGLGVDMRIASVLFGIGWVTVLWFEGLYRLRARWSAWTEAKDLAKSTLLLAALTLSVLYLSRERNVSRLFLLTLFVVQPIVTITGRAVFRAIFGEVRRRGYNTRYMLVVGTGTLAQQFAERVEGRSGLGIRIIGHLAMPDTEAPQVSRPIVGTMDDLAAVFHAQVVDEVAICLPSDWAHLSDPIARLAAEEGKTVRIPVDPLEGSLGSSTEEEFEGYVVRSFVGDHRREVALVLKRIVDIVGAAVALVLSSPILLVVALVIRARDGRPVLFRQTRIGLHGRPFTIYKFRTMVPDAEERYAEVERLSDTKGAAFKMADDPRVTRLGRVLRKTSIDELPQFWNVLRGEMSLVGPRPAPPREVAAYDVWHRRRLSMRPGISGLWQVESRMDEDFDERATLDLRYIDAWSPWLDVKILARTIPAVLARQGR
ncbi:MAG: sugar transferase [Candidatus Limnocylindrales bacterium]